MRSKVNARGIRLLKNKNWNSQWCAPKKIYKDLLHNDLNLISDLENYLLKKEIYLSDYKINRFENKIFINLSICYLGLFRKDIIKDKNQKYLTIYSFLKRSHLKYLKDYKIYFSIKDLYAPINKLPKKYYLASLPYKWKTFLNKRLKRILGVALVTIKYANPKILTIFISKIFRKSPKHQIFIKDLKIALKLALLLNVNNKNKIIHGLKIQIKGKINSRKKAKRSRTINITYGNLPLNSLDLNIDYDFKDVFTIYGVFGVKVWIFYQNINIKENINKKIKINKFNKKNTNSKQLIKLLNLNNFIRM